MSHEKMGMDHSAQELGRKRSEIKKNKNSYPMQAQEVSFYVEKLQKVQKGG